MNEYYPGGDYGLISHFAASLIQIGNFGSAYFTTATAIHTFNALVLKNHPKIWMSVIIILVGIGASVAVGV